VVTLESSVSAETAAAAPDAPRKRVCLLVLGMHRSGTSALTRVLSIMGAQLPLNVMRPGPGNETGYWEPEKLVLLHEALLANAESSWDDFRPLPKAAQTIIADIDMRTNLCNQITMDYGNSELFVLKDPRLCRLVPVYLDVFASMNITAKVIIPFRNPLAVVRSLAARSDMPLRTFRYGSLVWLRHILDAEKTTRGIKRIIVNFEAFMQDWNTALTQITCALNIEWPTTNGLGEQEIHAFLKSELDHQSAGAEDLAAELQIPEFVKRAFSAFQQLEINSNDIAAQQQLDSISVAFDATITISTSATYTELQSRQQILVNEYTKTARNHYDLQTHARELSDIIEVRDSEVARLKAALAQQHLEFAMARLGPEKSLQLDSRYRGTLLAGNDPINANAENKLTTFSTQSASVDAIAFASSEQRKWPKGDVTLNKRDKEFQSEVLKLHKAPLYSVDGLTMADGTINMAGLVLAPRGDPRAVRVRAGNGIRFSELYQLPSPGAEEYYWYWPEADNSGYRITIDLAASRDQSEAFQITFVFDAPEVAYPEIRNSIYIPKDIRKYQNFPGSNNLTRVQHFESINSVVVRGYSDYRRIVSICEKYGLSLSGKKILDWGCGHGRVIRHFCDQPGVSLSGVDIDSQNVLWAQENLHHVSTLLGPLMPPLPYPGNEFDLVYGISVMTHLTERVQNAWLEELRRITRPGGLVLLTFSGDTDVAFASRSLDKAYIDKYLASGRGADLASSDLVGVIDNEDYYKNVKVSARIVTELCGIYFEVLDVLECMFGYQDLAVLRRI
jgi:SAM-dependent methyltransferase